MANTSQPATHEPKEVHDDGHQKAEKLHKLLSTLAHDSHSAMVGGLDKEGKPTAAFNWSAFLQNAAALLPVILELINHFKSVAPEPKLASDEHAPKK